MSERGRCLLCGGCEGRAVLEERGYTGRACCGMVYLDPAPPEDSVDPLYDGHFDTYYRRAAGVRLDFISSVAPAGKLLEVGCGRAHLLALARARGYEVAGVDPNPECARFAGERGIAVECAAIEDARAPARSFDVVYHVDMLSHFADPIRSLEAIADRVAPEGVLAFEVALLAAIDPRWYRAIGGAGVPAHRWLYSEASVAAVLAKIGFEIIRTRSFALAPELVLFGAAKLAAKLARKPFGRRLRERYGFAEFWDGRPRLAPSPRGLARVYDRAAHVLRYGAGALGPFPGPRTSFVAATRKAASSPKSSSRGRASASGL